ncbi:hypothetical protein ACROYT_G006860 [Oculina patagonica]
MTERTRAVASSSENSYKGATDTMKKLFHEDNYDKRLRPYYKGPPLNITVDMSVVHLGKVREIDMDFSVDVFFRQYWHDPRLNHTLDEPIFLTGSYRDLIWLPDTFFLNIKTAVFHNVPADNSRVKIKQNGQITWSSRITMTANCQLDLRDYPLDEQSCNLTLLSYAYPLQHVDYFWKARDKQGIVILADEMNEFTLTDIKTRKGNGSVWNPWLDFRLHTPVGSIHFRASPWILVYPNLRTDGSDRLTLMGSFRSSVPKVSYIKALDVFFIISFFFVFGAVVEYVIVILHDEKKLKEQQKEKDKVDFEMVPLKSGNETETLRMDIENHHDDYDNKTSPRRHLERPQSSSLGGLQKTKELVKFAFLENNASIIDRVSRILFPVAYSAFNIFYWCYYSVFKFNGV